MYLGQSNRFQANNSQIWCGQVPNPILLSLSFILETKNDIWWCFCQIGLVELWTSTAVKPMIKVWAARHNCVYNPLLWGVMLTLGDWERFISVFAILCLCICTWTFTVLSWGALRWLGVTGKSFKVLHLQVSLLQRLKTNSKDRQSSEK